MMPVCEWVGDVDNCASIIPDVRTLTKTTSNIIGTMGRGCRWCWCGCLNEWVGIQVVERVCAGVISEVRTPTEKNTEHCQWNRTVWVNYTDVPLRVNGSLWTWVAGPPSKWMLVRVCCWICAGVGNKYCATVISFLLGRSPKKHQGVGSSCSTPPPSSLSLSLSHSLSLSLSRSLTLSLSLPPLSLVLCPPSLTPLPLIFLSLPPSTFKASRISRLIHCECQIVHSVCLSNSTLSSTVTVMRGIFPGQILYQMNRKLTERRFGMAPACSSVKGVPWPHVTVQAVHLVQQEATHSSGQAAYF